MSRVPPTLPRRQGDLVFGGHVLLVLALVSWRTFESIPGLSARDGGGFTSSPAGRLLALATLLGACAASAVVVVQTARHWREPRLLALAVIGTLSFAMRTGIDVFDLCYAALAIGCGAWWFKHERSLPARRSGDEA